MIIQSYNQPQPERWTALRLLTLQVYTSNKFCCHNIIITIVGGGCGDTYDVISTTTKETPSDVSVQETSGQWRQFFYITAGINMGGALIFILLGKGEEQSWARHAPSVISVTTQEQTISVQDAATTDNSPPLNSGDCS